MSYEIIIKKRETIDTVQGKEWDVIGTREVARDEQFVRRSEGEPPTRIEEVRGYTPEIIKKSVRETEILKQVVDELDLAAVIKAINGL